MVGFGCDTTPNLPYNHNTWIWVGLNWKFMYLSMGSLWTSAIGVTPKAASGKKWNEMKELLENAYAVPGMADCHYWEAKLIGEVPILGYVIERLRLIIRILSMIIRDYTWRMYQMLWWKCTTSAECKTIQIAASAVMDGWMAILFRCQMFSKWLVTWKVKLTWPQQELWKWHLCSHLSNFRQIESLLLLSVTEIKLALCK